MKRRLLFFLCWISASGWLNSQNLEQTLVFAREQSKAGNTQLALKTYQRVLYFSGNAHRDECHSQLASLHAAAGEFERAAFYYDLIYQSSGTDSLRHEALFHKSAALMLQQQPKKALLELLSLPKNLPEPWQSRKQLYLGAAYFATRDFDKARQALLPLFGPENAPEKAEFEKLFRKAERVARKSPKTARLLSMFFPGAGQFYAGDIKNGLNSLLLNALLGYWFVVTGVNYSFIDAGATVTPWLFRYYGGGIRRAGEILEKKKDERLRKIFQKVLLTIEAER